MRRCLLAMLAVFALAPAPGDIGGCAQRAEELDPGVFYRSRRAAECRRCVECEFSEVQCGGLCGGDGTPDQFPEGCYPLVHDGTVCLRALGAASCSAIEGLFSEPPTFPAECNFCPTGIGQ